MGLLKWLEDKFTGQVVADYGPLSTNPQGLQVSVSLRKRSDGKQYLALKWEGKSTLHWEEFQLTPAVLARLKTIVEDATQRLGAG